jgi:hypothetical protein
MKRTPLDAHRIERDDSCLLLLFDLYKQRQIPTTLEYIERLLPFAAKHPTHQALLANPTHLTTEKLRSFENHKRAYALIEESNGPLEATDYCRDNDLPIRLCPTCGVTPSYQSICFGCSCQLPDPANENSTDNEIDR